MKDIIIGTCEKCGENFAHNCRCKYKPMNNTTYTANENCFLIDGEVYLIGDICRKGLRHQETVIISTQVHETILLHLDLGFSVTHSTKPLDGVKLLPRDKFVKPKDVLRKAIMYAAKNELNTTEVWPHFEAGHNANQNEFTRKEAQTLFLEGLRQGTTEYALKTFDEVVEMLRPLSLPTSIQINEQGEIVNVIW